MLVCHQIQFRPIVRSTVLSIEKWPYKQAGLTSGSYLSVGIPIGISSFLPEMQRMVRTHVVVSLCQCDIGLPYHFLLLRLHKNCCWEYGGHYSENANVVYFPVPAGFRIRRSKTSLSAIIRTWTWPVLRLGRRPNGFLGLSLNDRIILFLLILLAKTVSVG